MKYFTTTEAAALLSLTPEALQKRCARAATRRGRDGTEHVGEGDPRGCGTNAKLAAHPEG